MARKCHGSLCSSSINIFLITVFKTVAVSHFRNTDKMAESQQLLPRCTIKVNNNHMFVDSIKINNLDCVVQSHTRGANSRLFNQEAPPLAWNAMLHCVRRSRQVPVLGQKSCPG